MPNQHPRSDLTDALLAKLKSAFGRLPVEYARPDDMVFPQCPRILVYYMHETSDTVEGSDNFPKAYERSVTVNIDVCLEGSKDPEHDLDRLGWRVERCLFTDPTIGGVCYGVRLTTTDPIVTKVEDKTLYVQRQQWILKYRVNTYDESVSSLDDFLEFDLNMTKPEDLADISRESTTVIRTK